MRQTTTRIFGGSWNTPAFPLQSEMLMRESLRTISPVKNAEIHKAHKGVVSQNVFN